MPLYKNPDFLRPPPGLARIFGDNRQQSFFALPQWYDLMARFGVEAGTEIRVYTGERSHSSAAMLLQTTPGQSPLTLLSLANFYSIEHGPVGTGTDSLDPALDAIIVEI